MISETVTDNDYAKVLYYPEKGIVHHQWKKFCFGKTFQDIMMASTNCLKTRKGTKWLSDDTNFSVLSQEDTIWGQQTWFPETIAAGWKHWAIILPVKQVGKMNIKKLIAEYNGAGINTNVFENVDDAMKWLEAQ